MSNDGKFELQSPPVEAQERLTLGASKENGSTADSTNGEKRASTRRRKDSVRLVWDSKPKRPPSPRDIEFQTAEVVIPNPARDAAQIPLSFRDGTLHNEGPDRTQMNRLIWGDNLLAMQALLASGYEGKIDLIYIDPPFESKADYSYQLNVDGTEFKKEPSLIERLAYRDTWEAGTDSYLDMLYPRLQLMRRLLGEAGSIYVHCDHNVNAYLRALLDEIFGRSNFRSEIVWKRADSHNDAHTYGAVHDSLFLYSKSSNFQFSPQFVPLSDKTVSTWYRHVEEGTGRRYNLGNLVSPHPRPNLTYRFQGIEPPTNGWRVSKVRMQGYADRGLLVTVGKTKKTLKVKQYLDESRGRQVTDWWDDISQLRGYASGDDTLLGFNTQKPKKLLDRIIRASSSDGALIGDFFCGSGTTLEVAETLGRRWIGCDFGKVGIQVTRSRLVKMDAKPFLLENIGNYQREMIYLTGGRIGEMQRIILKLYGAMPHPQHRDLGTRMVDGNGKLTPDRAVRVKGSEAELVYVGYPDRPTTAKKVEELARLADSLDGKGYKRLIVLAWDYDYNFDQDWESRIKSSNKKLKMEVERRLIPPDVYDYLRKAKNEAELEKLADKIKFHEKPYLKLAKPKIKADKKSGETEVTIGINRYVIWDLPVPDREQPKLKELIKDNFAVLIDYWAVDWNYDGATFRSQWQAIRGNGKRAKIVPTEASHTLKLKRNHKIAVRVVDIFGNDAAAVITIDD
jgi:adenine-specific DNA-methyltransferase